MCVLQRLQVLTEDYLDDAEVAEGQFTMDILKTMTSKSNCVEESH